MICEHCDNAKVIGDMVTHYRCEHLMQKYPRKNELIKKLESALANERTAKTVLEQQNAVLKGACEFYADTKSWRDSTDADHMFDMIHESDLGDHVYNCNTIKTNSQGGKRARQALKECENVQ